MSEQHGDGAYRSSPLKDPSDPEKPAKAWVIQTFHFAHGNPVVARHACWKRSAYDEQRRLAMDVRNEYGRAFYEVKVPNNNNIQQINLHQVIKITYSVEDL